MPTINQLVRHPRKPRRHKKMNRELEACPQKSGIVIKLHAFSPKKPNSGNRATARVRLCSGREVTVLVPGEGHNLQDHAIVLVRGGRVRDLPGIRYKVVRGARDCFGVSDRKTSRSKYGVKKK